MRIMKAAAMSAATQILCQTGFDAMTTAQITLDTKLSRNDEMLYAPVGAEQAVMLSVNAGSYYGLNGVAVRIWELLERPATVAELCARLREEFEVNPQACETEVLKFASELIDNGIVRSSAA
jgi:hypothetical protein